ncbi:MAG: hypothetical protein JXX28_05950 [Deltaproteobacteria bacterium]|nr:hypothetical protein [Deltaproteobacteria bacterium]
MFLLALLACTPSPVEIVDTSVPWVLPECPSFSEGEALGSLTDLELDELSGITATTEDAGVLWAHNDSGDTARFFAVEVSGRVRGAVRLADTTAFDWEDITLAREGDAAWIWLADIGDNAVARPEVRLYRVAEPDPGALPAELPGERFTLRYSDGPHNAETLLWDPIDRALYILTKEDEAPSGLWRLPQPVVDGGVMERVGEVDLWSDDFAGSGLATGGEVSPDGLLLAVRTYTHVWAWRRDPARPLAEALGSPACELPVVGERQGEALTWVGQDYLTVSEGQEAPVHRFLRR